MSARDPVPLGDALGELGRRLGLPAHDAFGLLVATWSEVVGPDVAAHARVRGVRDGECIVEVDGPAWATRVRYLGPELQRRVNEASGAETVTRVTVVVNTPGKAL